MLLYGDTGAFSVVFFVKISDFRYFLCGILFVTGENVIATSE